MKASIPYSHTLKIQSKYTNWSTMTIRELKEICVCLKEKYKIPGLCNKKKQELYDILGFGTFKTQKELKEAKKLADKAAKEELRSKLLIDRGNDVIDEIDLRNEYLEGYTTEGSNIPLSVQKRYAKSDVAHESIYDKTRRGNNRLWVLGLTTGERLATKKGKTTYEANQRDLFKKDRFLNFCKAVQVIKREFPEKTRDVPALNDWRDLQPEHIALFYNKKIGKCVLKGEEQDRKTTSTLKHFYVWVVQQQNQQLL